MNTLPSFHDHLLVSYSVDCEARKLEIHVKHWERAERRIVVFSGVIGYHLQNDAFGNIIFSLEQVLLERFLSEYASEIIESYRLAGALGGWTTDLSAAPQVLKADGVETFILSSSYGLSGWVLARGAGVHH